MSSGQLPRNPLTFPRMNDRAGRRRARRTLVRARRFVAEINAVQERRFAERMKERYSRGGFIPPSGRIRVHLDVDECIVVRRDSAYRCARKDPAHLATHSAQGEPTQ